MSVKLIKSMYACQDVPVIIFNNNCPHPCLYCGLSKRKFLEEDIIATGEDEVIKKLSNFKGAYFSPTSDCFLTENAELTHRLIEAVWKNNNIFVPLVITKQIIPEQTITLFAKNKDRLVLQISVPSLNEEVIKILEPGSTLISERLKLIKKLTEKEVPVTTVIMPWFNLDEDIESLPQKLSALGIKRVIVATGVLPDKQRQKMINSKNELIRKAALETELTERSTKNGYVIPSAKRIKLLGNMVNTCNKYQIKAVICTADNHDLEKSSLSLCRQFKHHNFKS